MALRARTGVRERRLAIMTTTVLFGTFASVVYHYVEGYYHGRPYPFNTFLFRPEDHFMDFYNPLRDAAAWNAGAGDRFIYTPFAHLFFTVLGWLTPERAFVLYTLCFLAVFWYMVWHIFLEGVDDPWRKVQWALILGVMTYPFLVAIDRGNLEELMFVLLFGFLYSYHRSERRWLPCLLLAGAIALKIYPATLLLLPLSDRRYRETAYTAVVSAGGILVSAAVLGIISHRGFVAVLARSWQGLIYQQQELGFRGLHFAHTLYGLLGVLLERTGQSAAFARLTGPYTRFALIALVALGAYVFFVEREPWRKAAVLLIAAIVLPLVSGDYTLVHVFPVVMLFLAAQHQGRFERVYVVLFSLLLIPLDYYRFESPALVVTSPFGSVLPEVSSSVVVYPLVMLALMGLIIYEGFRGRAEETALEPKLAGGTILPDVEIADAAVAEEPEAS